MGKKDMSEKFKCVECGEVEVDDEDDICDDCALGYEENSEDGENE